MCTKAKTDCDLRNGMGDWKDLEAFWLVIFEIKFWFLIVLIVMEIFLISTVSRLAHLGSTRH